MLINATQRKKEKKSGAKKNIRRHNGNNSNDKSDGPIQKGSVTVEIY